MSSKAKLFKGFTFLVGGRVGNALLSILSTAILARLLTPEEFGLVSATLIILALSNVIFDGAFGTSIVKKRELTLSDQRTTLAVALMLSFILMGLIVFLSQQIETFFQSEAIGDLLFLAVLTIPCKAIFAVSSALLQRNGHFGSIAFGSIAGQLVGNIGVAVPMAVYDMGAWALVTGMVVAGAVEAAFIALKSKLSFYPELERAALHDIAGSSLFSLANVMNWVANTGANAVVGRSMGFHELGIYSRGWKLLDLVVGLTATPLSRVLLPAFSSRRDDPARLAAAFQQAFHIAVPAYACLSAFLILQAPIIVYLALGPQWSETTVVAQLFFAALVPRCAFKISENFAVAIGRSGAAVIRQSIYAALMVCGAIIGLSNGVSGVALMTSFAVTLFYLMSIGYALKVGGLSPFPILLIHVKACALAALIAITDMSVVSFFSDWSLFIRHLAGGTAGVTAMVTLISIAPVFWLGPVGKMYLPQLRKMLSKLKLA
ncbi:oligosaccharide flippase family protein [Rhizobium sp.]|uniref:oligosaccharide flippase family protein n=1 Tax=Rhizobium sp. TaxID=391 RepID=UPI0028B2582A